jgi:iron complex transport system substrate-binding protein
MSKSVRKFVLPLMLAVMLLMSACVTQTPPTQPANPPEPTAPATEPTVEEPTAEPTEEVIAEPTAEPIVIVDVVGREVTLEKPATKLVGTHNPTLNAAVVLGGGGKYLVGFGNKSMGRGLYEQVIEGFDDMLEVGRGSNINLESVIASGAELVILPERHQDLVPQFEAANIPVLVILDSTESFETIQQTLTLLGMALGESEKAEHIGSFLNRQLENAQTLLKDTTEKPSVLFLGSSSALSVAPGSMIQTSLIEAAGGVNAVSGVEGLGGFVDVSIEQIIAWNPDVIWFPQYSDYTAEDLLNDPAWSSISAVQNNRVYQFPSLLEPWDQPTLAVALGIDWALHSLHPDLYSFEDLMINVDEFFTIVYDKTFTAEQLGIE